MVVSLMFVKDDDGRSWGGGGVKDRVATASGGVRWSRFCWDVGNRRAGKIGGPLVLEAFVAPWQDWRL